MPNLAISFDNQIGKGANDKVKIYAFAGAPDETYTWFKIVITNNDPNDFYLKKITLKIPKAIIPASIVNNNYSDLSTMLVNALGGAHCATSKAPESSGDNVVLEATLNTATCIDSGTDYPFRLQGLFADSTTPLTGNYSIMIGILEDGANKTAITKSFPVYLDKTQVTNRDVIQAKTLQKSDFSFGVFGNSNLINDSSVQNQYIDFYLSVDGGPSIALPIADRKSPNRIHVGFCTMDTVNTPQVGSAYINTENVIKTFHLRYFGHNYLSDTVPDYAIDEIFSNRTGRGDSDPFRQTISLNNGNTCCYARSEINSTSLTGMYRFRIFGIQVAPNLTPGVVKIQITLFLAGLAPIEYEIPIFISALKTTSLYVHDRISFANEKRGKIQLWDGFILGIQEATMYFRTGRNFAWFRGGAHDNGEINAGSITDTTIIPSRIFPGTVDMVLREGRLGIGTDSPTEKLDVNGTAHISGVTTLDGDVRIGKDNTSTSILKYPNNIKKKLISLYEDVIGSLHQYYGFGMNAYQLNYQVGNERANHVFYAGTSEDTSKELMRIQGNGNVGIGTATPAKKLDVNGDAHITGVTTLDGNVGIGTLSPTKELDVNGDAHISGVTTLDGNVGIGTSAPAQKLAINSGSTNALRIECNANTKALSIGGTGVVEVDAVGVYGGRFKIQDDGNVGIGTASPSKKLDVNGDTNISGCLTVTGKSDRFAYNGHYFRWSDGNLVNITGTDWGECSIIASGSIMTRDRIIASSDRRIKTDIQTSEAPADLAILRSLRVTDYRHIDRVRNGNAFKKGFIAQEVAELFPEAVAKSPDFVPNVYALASSFELESGMLTVSLEQKHDFAPGDEIKLMFPDGEKNCKVAAVPDETGFSVDWAEAKPENVFVFGKKVNDFNSLDYDRISTLNVSATQELARLVEALKKEHDTKIATLEQEIARLRDLIPGA